MSKIGWDLSDDTLWVDDRNEPFEVDLLDSSNKDELKASMSTWLEGWLWRSAAHHHAGVGLEMDVILT